MQRSFGTRSVFVAATPLLAYATDFDGVNDRPYATAVDAGGAQSIGAWIRHDGFASGTARYLLGWGSNLNNCAVVEVSVRTLTAYVITSGALRASVVAANAMPASNAWTHVALCRDAAGAYTLYVNGVSVGSLGTWAPAVTTTIATFGTQPSLTLSPLDGRIASGFITAADMGASLAALVADKQSEPTADHLYRFGDTGRTRAGSVDGAGSGTSVIYDVGTVGGYDLAAGAAQGFAVDSIVTDYPT